MGRKKLRYDLEETKYHWRIMDTVTGERVCYGSYDPGWKNLVGQLQCVLFAVDRRMRLIEERVERLEKVVESERF